MKMQIHNPISRIREAITHARHNHTSQPHPTPIDHNDAIEILSSERRRYTIEFLADQQPNEPVSVRAVTQHVAAKENDCPEEGLSSKQKNRVYVSLYQQHLETLEPAIDYDREHKQITPTETPDRLWSAYQDFCTRLDG